MWSSWLAHSRLSFLDARHAEGLVGTVLVFPALSDMWTVRRLNMYVPVVCKQERFFLP